MNKLSRREKILIYVLVCFLIGLFGLYFVVKPSYEKFIVVNEQAAEAKFTQQSMEMTIDGIPATMQARDDANAKLAGLKTPFSAKLPNEGVDSLLTQMCLGYSLSPRVLAIEGNALQGVPTFTEYYSDKGASAAVGGADTTADSAATTKGTDTAQSTENTSTGAVQTWSSVVNMQLTGNQTNFYRLLDGVSARPDIVISDFYIEPLVNSEAVTSTSGSSITNVVYSGYVPKLDGGNITISVTFIVYMVEK